MSTTNFLRDINNKGVKSNVHACACSTNIIGLSSGVVTKYDAKNSLVLMFMLIQDCDKGQTQYEGGNGVGSGRGRVWSGGGGVWGGPKGAGGGDWSGWEGGGGIWNEGGRVWSGSEGCNGV